MKILIGRLCWSWENRIYCGCSFGCLYYTNGVLTKDTRRQFWRVVGPLFWRADLEPAPRYSRDREAVNNFAVKNFNKPKP